MQLLWRWQKRSHLRRCLGRRQQATALKLTTTREARERRENNSKFNNR
jgi:hypothetical protein